MHDAFALSTIPGTGAIRRFIPLRWYWPGALANASLYMVLLFLPLTITSWGVWKTRQHLRRRAGRCAACGYDLRGADHAVCPECGGA